MPLVCLEEKCQSRGEPDVVKGHARSLHNEQSTPGTGVAEPMPFLRLRSILLTQDYSPSHEQFPTVAKGNNKCFH